MTPNYEYLGPSARFGRWLWTVHPAPACECPVGVTWHRRPRSLGGFYSTPQEPKDNGPLTVEQRTSHCYIFAPYNSLYHIYPSTLFTQICRYNPPYHILDNQFWYCFAFLISLKKPNFLSLFFESCRKGQILLATLFPSTFPFNVTREAGHGAWENSP